jgi:L-seryl-tRNA(Ser) seleniumtransferase
MTDRDSTSPAREPASSSDKPNRRKIPSVEKILASENLAPLIERHGRKQVKEALGPLLDQARQSGQEVTMAGIASRLASEVATLEAPSMRPLINGSGVLIHTNLGRSPILESLWSDAGTAVHSYSNLELDFATGQRGNRDVHIESVSRRLFGCQAALLTNNNAAATLLLMAAVAAGREVVVSRGELVEIGGSFRVPEVIQQGGARLREVGTTNRTRAEDYARVVDGATAAFLRVHRSNFEIVGFTESPDLDELVSVAHQAGLPLLYDEGSGRVVDLSPYGFRPAPTIRDVLERGVDVVTCSTDKLIGATQGGLILGRKEIIDRCRKHPLMRALRAGKESYAVVTATLQAFVSGRHEERIPIYGMLATSLQELRARGERFLVLPGVRLVESASALGGGTTPSETIPSLALELPGPAETISRALLDQKVPIIGRIQQDRVTLDLRTIFPLEDEVVLAEVKSLL